MEKKLGFGCMRLPMSGGEVDYEEFNNVDYDRVTILAYTKEYFEKLEEGYDSLVTVIV